MPAKLVYVDTAVGGKLRYFATAIRLLRGDRSHDLVVCGHINLMPLAWLVSRLLKVPLILFIYGIDAWQPTRNRLANRLAKRADWVVSISDITAQKFRSWASAGTQQLLVLPNAIHAEWYGPGAKNPDLLKRYQLEGKTVLMTLGRLVSAERYKGFDEVLDLLPVLRATMPNLAYLIVGDGSDRTRLAAKVKALGLTERVVFAGKITEAEKADHYRLADAYIMASRGEGFGFVLLEAMACGIPVVASKLDGGREAVREGQLGRLVDPGNQDELQRAIVEALADKSRAVPSGLEYFSFAHFESRVHTLIGQVLADPARPFGGT
jgi:glycosyltransferase involved in cell wall biosynthesis